MKPCDTKRQVTTQKNKTIQRQWLNRLPNIHILKKNPTSRWVDFKTTHQLDGCTQNLHMHIHSLGEIKITKIWPPEAQNANHVMHSLDPPLLQIKTTIKIATICEITTYFHHFPPTLVNHRHHRVTLKRTSLPYASSPHRFWPSFVNQW
jgi:hypothetical protein